MKSKKIQRYYKYVGRIARSETNTTFEQKEKACSLVSYTYIGTTHGHPRQPEEFPFIILPLSVFNFVKNIGILEDHLAEPLCNFVLQWEAPHAQNWPVFKNWNTLAEMLNSWFPGCVQTGTVVTIIYVLLDMLLFRRRGLVFFVSTLQTMEHSVPKSEDIFWRNSSLWSGHAKGDWSEALQPTERTSAGGVRKL